MFKDYIIFFLKKIKKQKSNSTFFIMGVSITIATIVLIQSLLTERVNPNNFIKYPDRMVINDYSSRTDSAGTSTWSGPLNYKLIKDYIFKNNLQEKSSVFSSTGFQHWVKDERISNRILYADANYFDFFNFKLINGRFFTQQEVENAAQVILIDKPSSLKIFGNLEVLGQSIEISEKNYQIIGVIDAFPQTEFANFDLITPISNDELSDRETTINESSYNYSCISLVKLQQDVPSFKQEIISNSKQFDVRPEDYEITLFPYLINEHYFSKRLHTIEDWGLLNDSEWQFFLSSILLISILSIICLINITNLSVTSYLNRNMELGVRYAFGATWKDTLKQSLAESTVYIISIFLISLTLSFLFLGLLNSLEYYPKLDFKVNRISLSVVIIYSISFPLIANVLSILKLSKVYPIHLLKGIQS
jgi:putative ABC transport system permease protein